MISPISARIPSELRQDLAKYCVEHGISQTEAISAGLELLMASPHPGTPVSPQDAVAGLAELERELAEKLVGFDPEAAEDEGRD